MVLLSNGACYVLQGVHSPLDNPWCPSFNTGPFMRQDQRAELDPALQVWSSRQRLVLQRLPLGRCIMHIYIYIYICIYIYIDGQAGGMVKLWVVPLLLQTHTLAMELDKGLGFAQEEPHVAQPFVSVSHQRSHSPKMRQEWLNKRYCNNVQHIVWAQAQARVAQARFGRATCFFFWLPLELEGDVGTCPCPGMLRSCAQRVQGALGREQRDVTSLDCLGHLSFAAVAGRLPPAKSVATLGRRRVWSPRHGLAICHRGRAS